MRWEKFTYINILMLFTNRWIVFLCKLKSFEVSFPISPDIIKLWVNAVKVQSFYFQVFIHYNFQKIVIIKWSLVQLIWAFTEHNIHYGRFSETVYHIHSEKDDRRFNSLSYPNTVIISIRCLIFHDCRPKSLGLVWFGFMTYQPL